MGDDFRAHKAIESVNDNGFFGTGPAQLADDDIWWERWRNRPRTENGTARRKRECSSRPGPSDPTTSYIKIESGGRPTADQNQDDDVMEEMRILIKMSGPIPEHG